MGRCLSGEKARHGRSAHYHQHDILGDRGPARTGAHTSAGEAYFYARWPNVTHPRDRSGKMTIPYLSAYRQKVLIGGWLHLGASFPGDRGFEMTCHKTIKLNTFGCAVWGLSPKTGDGNNFAWPKFVGTYIAVIICVKPFKKQETSIMISRRKIRRLFLNICEMPENIKSSKKKDRQTLTEKWENLERL